MRTLLLAIVMVLCIGCGAVSVRVADPTDGMLGAEVIVAPKDKEAIKLGISVDLGELYALSKHQLFKLVGKGGEDTPTPTE